MFDVNNASKFAIGEETVSDGVNYVVVSSAIPGIREVLLVDAEGPDVNPLCTRSTSDLWEVHGSPWFVCSLVADKFVLLEAT